MLQSIRDHTQGWIAGVIVSMLILSFALWGIHSYILGGPATTVVAKVNGAEISRNQLSVAYERLRRQLQLQFNGQIPVQAELSLKNRALQTLINIYVLQQASLQQHYRISSTQVDAFLENMQEFQVNGQFSASRFEQMLETTLYSARDFLELIKTSLLIDQPRLGIIFTSFALPNEINDSIALINQERDIQYARLSTTNLTNQNIQISEEQIKAYYQQHENEFKTPEQVSIEYVELSLKDLMSGINPTDELLARFYNENYKTSSTESFTQAKNKVKQAYIRQQAEEKFAGLKEKLANISYEHPESLNAVVQALGLSIKSTGMFAKDEKGQGIAANNKIRDAAFSDEVLNQKNNSDVIQISSDDVVVLRVKSHAPAALQALENVKPSIINKLKNIAIQNKLAELANEIKTKLQTTGGDLNQITQLYHINWNKLGYIGRHSNKVEPAVLDAAFAAPKPASSNKHSFAITKIPNGYAVIALYGVRDGQVSGDKKQYQVFAEQLQNTQGLMEYELYKDSLVRQAKIEEL